MSTKTKLILPKAKSISKPTSESQNDQIDPASTSDDGSSADTDVGTMTDKTPLTASSNIAAGAGVTAKYPDRSKQVATVTKTWISGGYAGTGKDRVQIEATYPATRDIRTGVTNIGSDSFKLTITDLNSNVSSTIDRYPFSNTDWTQIPVPDADDFDVRGNVKIDVQTSGKMMRVQFHVNTASDISDIGYIFVLDVPEDTPFADETSNEPSS